MACTKKKGRWHADEMLAKHARCGLRSMRGATSLRATLDPASCLHVRAHISFPSRHAHVHPQACVCFLFLERRRVYWTRTKMHRRRRVRAYSSIVAASSTLIPLPRVQLLRHVDLLLGRC
eukprot:996852-Pleurochrysis_carterae.AAC.1